MTSHNHQPLHVLQMSGRPWKFISDFWLSRCCYAVVGLIAALSLTHMISLIQTDWCISLNVMFVGHLFSIKCLNACHHTSTLRGFASNVWVPALQSYACACSRRAALRLSVHGGEYLLKCPQNLHVFWHSLGSRNYSLLTHFCVFRLAPRRATECKAGEGNVCEAGKSCSSSI